MADENATSTDDQYSDISAFAQQIRAKSPPPTGGFTAPTSATSTRKESELETATENQYAQLTHRKPTPRKAIAKYESDDSDGDEDYDNNKSKPSPRKEREVVGGGGSRKGDEPDLQSTNFILVQLTMARLQWTYLFVISLINHYIVSKTFPAFTRPSVHITKYRFLKKREVRHPIWVAYVEHWMYLAFAITVTMLVFIYGRPYVVYYLKAFLATNTQTVNISEPLRSEDVHEFISDFCYTEGFSEAANSIREVASAHSDAFVSGRIDPSVNVDADGNGIDDRYEYAVAERVYDILNSGSSIELNELNPDFQRNPSAANSNGQQLSSIAPLAPSLIPSTNMLCGIFSQFNTRSQNLILTRGCYDMLKFSLDFKYNKVWVSQETQRSKELMENKGRSFAALQDQQEKNAAINRMIFTQQQTVGDHPYKCACSAHYGIANLWAYSTYVGEESQFLIDYEVSPLTLEESANAEKMMRSILMEFRDDPALQAVDTALWEKLGRYLTQQPLTAIRVNTKLVPPKSYIERYYGSEYGDSLRATISGMAQALQRKQIDIDGGTVVETSWFLRLMLWLETKVRSTEDPTNFIDEMNNNVLNVRNKLLEMRRNVTKANKNKDWGEAVAKVIPILANWGITKRETDDSDFLLTQPIPQLATNSSYLVNYPHSACAVHCLDLHQELMHKRQRIYNIRNGFTSAIDLNPPRKPHAFITKASPRPVS